MGVYYFYVNETREEYFSIDPTNQAIKWPFVGQNFGSRAFSILLLHDHPDYSYLEPHPMVGSWLGGNVRITGDDYEPQLAEIHRSYRDIGPEVIDMMSQADPYSFLACGGVPWLRLYAEAGIPEPVRRRLLTYYRRLNHEQPRETHAEMVAVLRPR